MDRMFVIFGALFAATGVGLGAFGAHALRSRLEPRMLEIFETAVRYQMYHALALIVLAWVAWRWPSSWISVSGWLMISGTLIFSGTLVALALSGFRWLGAITPIGGTLLLLAWVALAWGVFRSTAP